MSEDSFCFWCGFDDRNARGHCRVCYPPGYLPNSLQDFYSHVLFVRKKELVPLLNFIDESKVIPHDINSSEYRRPDLCNDNGNTVDPDDGIRDIPACVVPDRDSSGIPGSVPNHHVHINLKKLKRIVNEKV